MRENIKQGFYCITMILTSHHFLYLTSCALLHLFHRQIISSKADFSDHTSEKLK
jgi:hypothetical protein